MKHIILSVLLLSSWSAFAFTFECVSLDKNYQVFVGEEEIVQGEIGWHSLRGVDVVDSAGTVGIHLNSSGAVSEVSIDAYLLFQGDMIVGHLKATASEVKNKLVGDIEITNVLENDIRTEIECQLIRH